jgi:hypothetical protein
MAGEVPHHDTCLLNASERAVRRQQVALTVSHLLDPVGEHQPPVVRLREANGVVWEVVADLAYVDPSYRGTPAPTDATAACVTSPSRPCARG